MGRWRPPRRGHHHILGGGIAHISPLCYTESEIPAALRAVGHTAVFRTQRRREREGKYIRAAKWHIEPDTARHPAARISKPYPRKGTETASPREILHLVDEISKPYPRKGTETIHTPSDNCVQPAHFKTISPQGDGNNVKQWDCIYISIFQNHIPARGRKRNSCTENHRVIPFQNHIPARGRKHLNLTRVKDTNTFQNHIPARGRKLEHLLLKKKTS